jgi:hypothetical protein
MEAAGLPHYRRFGVNEDRRGSYKIAAAGKKGISDKLKVH